MCFFLRAQVGNIKAKTKKKVLNYAIQWGSIEAVDASPFFTTEILWVCAEASHISV